MLRNSYKAALFLSVLFAALILSGGAARAAASASNTKLGKGALLSKPTGTDNTGLGFNALHANTNGAFNTAVGSGALQDNIGGINYPEGSFNTAVGSGALNSNTTGAYNTAMGNFALSDNTFGSQNTAIGQGALIFNTGGYYNTAVGLNALSSNTTGGGNTAIGWGANVSQGVWSNATAIGYGAIVNAINKVRLGNSAVTLVETAGNLRVGAGTTTGCVQDGDGTAISGVCVSDARLKKDISHFELVLDKLAQLQPVHFRWKAEEYPERQFGSAMSFGLIAQEVEKLLPEMVTEDAKGVKAVRYNLLPLLLLQALKEQREIIQRQQVESREKESKIVELESRLEAVEWLIRERPNLTASTQPLR